jgi:glucose/arabinose dehydrogenase
MQKISRRILGLLTISCLAIASCGESGGCSNCGTGGSGATGGPGGSSGNGGSSGQGGNRGTVSGLDVKPVISGLDHPWDIAWLPNGIMLVTERPGRLNIYGNGIDQEPSLVIEPDDLVASGEGGMLGLEVDPSFDSNGYVYVCFCSNAGGANPEYVPDVRLVRYTLSTPNGDRMLLRDEIVTDMPYSTGRHSGCRPRFDPDGDYLWVGTGDAAVGTLPTTPQDDESLGGKVLRIDRDGTAHPDNAGGRLWFSKGHRNIQGMAFRTTDGLGMSAEHGPSIDDEINLLVEGNFGWDPGAGYIEPGVPMTDTEKYPDAVEAVWSSGSPTLAISGATFIEGSGWGNWDGVLAVAALRDEHLHIFFVDDEGNVTDGGEYIKGRNRLRTPRMGPDGLLYITEDVRGGPSDVLQVSPVLTPDAN